MDDLRGLAEWAPPLGVVSVAFSAHPGDRSEAWRPRVRDGLHGIAAEHEDDGHELKVALRATSERITQRFGEDVPPPARAMVGFVEVARGDADERWFGAEIELDRFLVDFAARPAMGPLVELVDAGRPRGIAVLSSERIRLLELVAGRTAKVREFELTTYELAWRERKAQSPPDPAHGHATSASGKDQYEQRLDANRERWLAEVAAEIAGWASDGRPREILVLGETQIAGHFVGALGTGVEAAVVAEVDAISEPENKVAARVAEALPGLERRWQLSLVERATDAARSGGRGALGLQETAQALAEGRVDRLLVDLDRTFDPDPDLAAAIGVDAGEWEPGEWLVQTAIVTSAAITPVRGEAASRLEADDGVAAILRY